MTPREKAENFLSISHKFKLGEILTEKPHPATVKMSHLANNDLPEAVRILKELDLSLFPVLRDKAAQIKEMSDVIHETIRNGGRVFLSGCGATGRLSLSLEYFWRLQVSEELKDKVFGFMAGGDSALIKSIEKFEDHPEFAVRQMQDLGFRDGDLMIATTEGGETPFVIGTAEEAVRVSKVDPFFLYCNPDEVLMNIERSKNVIKNPRIRKMNLTCGSMALSGSTRMQASTIQMAAIGLALFCPILDTTIEQEINSMEKKVMETDFSFLPELIELESGAYKENDYVLYETNDYGITLLTDSTERSPTFSLTPFENVKDPNPTPSLCYICYPDEQDSKRAWTRLLAHEERALNWDGNKELSSDYLYGFDISSNIKKFREELVSPSKLHIFKVWKENDLMQFSFKGKTHTINVAELSILCEHTLLKLIMNTHSTLIMGRLDRYMDNIMIWVRPSNFKLIDRSIRYIRHLLSARGIEISYKDTAYKLYEEIETLGRDEPIVLKTVESIIRDAGNNNPEKEESAG